MESLTWYINLAFLPKLKPPLFGVDVFHLLNLLQAIPQTKTSLVRLACVFYSKKRLTRIFDCQTQRYQYQVLCDHFFEKEVFMNSFISQIGVPPSLYGSDYVDYKMTYSRVEGIYDCFLWVYMKTSRGKSSNTMIFLVRQGYPTTVFCKISVRRSKYCRICGSSTSKFPTIFGGLIFHISLPRLGYFS